MRGPIEEIARAADTLDALMRTAMADLESDDYWKPYDPETAWRDGLVNGFGGPSSELAGVLSPAAVAEIVRHMREEVRRSSWRHTFSVHLLAFARIVNSASEEK